MRAVVLEKVGEYPRLVERNRPVPGRGEVLIRIICAALNHRDLWISKGLYPGIREGVILGSDGAGVVEEVGEGVDRSWIGKEVIINPSINWGGNPLFQSSEYEILGNPRDGTLADYVIVPVEQIIERPVHLSWEESAALPLAGLTAYRALFTRANLRPGEKVLITGIGGGVALMGLKMAVAVGAAVWVTSGSEEKILKAKELGAVGGFNYKEQDWYKLALKEAGEFDVILDGASGPSLEIYTMLLSPGGRLVIYGQTAGAAQQFRTARLFYRQLNILGSTMGSPRDFELMVRMWNNIRIKPVIDSIWSPEDIREAFARMDSGVQFGKIVVDFRK